MLKECEITIAIHDLDTGCWNVMSSDYKKITIESPEGLIIY